MKSLLMISKLVSSSRDYNLGVSTTLEVNKRRSSGTRKKEGYGSDIPYQARSEAAHVASIPIAGDIRGQ